MMHVAFRTLATGLKNPYCSTDQNAAGCHLAPTSLGLQKSSYIVIYAFANYVGSTDTWGVLANRFRAAAKDLYTNCSASTNREAEIELDAINIAFAQIGFPATETPAPRCY